MLSEAIVTLCCALPKGEDAHKDADVVTDVADRASHHHRDPPCRTRFCTLAHRAHAHAHTRPRLSAAAAPRASNRARACGSRSPWGPPPSLPSAQRSNASGSAVVAPSAALASSTQCFGWRQARARYVSQDGTGEASACPDRARYAAATRRDKSECICKALPKGPPTGHDKALRRDAIKGERIYKALAKAPPPTGNGAVPRRNATNGERTCKVLPKRPRPYMPWHRDASQVRGAAKLMTGTTKILTETTRLDEPNDGVRRRKRRNKSRKFVYFNCRKRHLSLRSS
jgi:hypothetical protein